MIQVDCRLRHPDLLNLEAVFLLSKAVRTKI